MEIIASQLVETNVLKSNEVSTEDVAKGYGVSVASIREHKKNHSDELIEGIHYVTIPSQRNTPKTMWTLDGIHMLGFFIKSDRAKSFRIYVAKLLTEIRIGNIQIDQKQNYKLERENVELKRLVNRLTSNGYLADVEKIKEIHQAWVNVKWRVASMIEAQRKSLAEETRILETLEKDVEIMGMYEEFHGPYELTKPKKVKLLK